MNTEQAGEEAVNGKDAEEIAASAGRNRSLLPDSVAAMGRSHR